MRTLSSAVFLASTLFLVTIDSPAQTAEPAPPAYASDPKFVAAMAEATQLIKQHRYDFAEDSYKKANKIAEGKCLDCLKRICALQSALKDYKAAEKTAVVIEGLETTPKGKSIAELTRAQIIVESSGDKPKPAQMEAAHALLQQSVESLHNNAASYFLDGKVLTHLGRLDEAKQAFTQAAEHASIKDPSHLRAEHFAENPELSLHKMAPAFEVSALDGSRFNLDAMGGRVVLIDFWATWCGPCNEELPHMRKIAQEFTGEPLVIISVSWDADETKWKDFVSKNNMTWLQYRDADHKLSDEFGINAIPHYFTIDSDGVLTAEMLGSGSDVEGKLKKLIQRARESQKQLAVSEPPARN